MLNLIRLPSYPLISDKFLVIIKKLQRIFLSLEAYTHGFCVFNELLVVVIRVLFEQISLNLKIDTRRGLQDTLPDGGLPLLIQ
jgi:hypothetical protein